MRWSLPAVLLLCGCVSAPEPPSVPGRDPLPPRTDDVACAPWVDGEFVPSLAATGCLPDGEPAPDLVPYTVRSPLWTDGAFKCCWLTVPPGETLGFDAPGPLLFPPGAALIKQFLAAPDRPVETRFMVWDGESWSFATYQHDGDDAALLTDSDQRPVTLQDGETVEWYFPDAEGCATCHLGGALGPVAAQLDTEYDYGDGVRSQLDELARVGLLAPFEAPEEEPLAIPADPSAPLEDRARAWLHANCAHCHRPGGWTPPDMTMDLRWRTPLSEARLCEPVQFDQAPESGRYRIAPGDPADSALWGRIATSELFRMPPVGVTRLDPVAEDTVLAWIEGMQGCE